MRRLFLSLVCLVVLWCGVTDAQVSSQNAKRLYSGTAVPTWACSPGPSYTDFYLRTSTSVLYYCSAANVWSVFTSAGGSGVTSVTGTANQIDVTGTTTPVLSTPTTFIAPGTSAAVTSLSAPFFKSTAADPADAGAIRLGNAELIEWEASPAGTDVTLTVNSSEQFVFSNDILNPTFINPALGTPASGVATNLTGTASGLTAGNVTTNANLTGDVTSVGNATTLATVNSNVGTFGSATQASQVTVNGKGLVTAASNVTVTPAVGSVTGLGTGVATALGVNVGTAGSFVVNGGALGSPSSAGTIPAFTLGGTIAGGGNQLNNIIIGTSTPLAGFFTTTNATSTSTANSFASVTSFYALASSGYLSASSNGVFLVTDTAQTSFGRLQLGGTSSSFPSLKRSGTGLISRLADDSADAPFTSSTGTFSSLTSGRVSFSSTGGLQVDDADLTFATDTLTATKIVGSTSITDSGLTSGRVTFAGASGILSDDADFLFATDTATITKIVGPTSISSGSIGGTSLRLGQTLEAITAANFGGAALSTYSSTANNAPVLDFNRSKSATPGTQTAVASGDNLGYVNFRGSDGTAFISGAQVQSLVDGTPGTNDMPGRLQFLTTPDGSATSVIRLIIGNAGAVTWSSGVTDATGTPGSLCYNTSTFEMYKNNALTCTVSTLLYKKNVINLPSFSAFDKLRPVQFAYRDQPDRSRWGFIAEEVAAADPKLADGYDDKGRPRSLDQNAILALTVGALKDLKIRVEALEKENARLRHTRRRR